MDRPHSVSQPPALPAEPATAEGGEHASKLQLPVHVHAKGVALGIIATVAFLYALQWGKNFLVPLLLGIFIAYTLNPLVNWLERIRIKRIVGATLVTGAIFGGAIVVIDKVQGEFQNIVEELPTITHKLSRLLASTTGSGTSALSRIQAIANEIEQATAGSSARRAARRQQDAMAASSATPAPHATPATPATPATVAGAAATGGIRVMDWVWVSARGLVGFLSQGTMVIFLVFFLLLSGDTFKRKLVKLTGPSLTKKKITVHILEDINTSIQAYMFMLLVTNVLLALLMWIALRAIGLENAGAWAIVAGLLHIMPYFGPLLITSATGLVAFLQFESLQMVLLVTGASLGIATLVGTFVTTWMTGRIARMNAAAVFVSLLFWGWLWGVWGLLLGVPVIVIVKVVAERVEGMEIVAELLGE